MQAFKKAAEKNKYNLTIYGADISNSAPAMFFCNKKVFVPRISDKEYIPFLMSTCKSEKIEALIPTIDTDLICLSENKAKFAEIGTKVIISDLDKIKICRDKYLTSKLFEKIGLNYPKAYNNYKEYNNKFPAFIKPKDGSSSINAFKILNIDELKSYSNRLVDYIVQPFIEGTEYTVDIFCDFEGNPIYITPRIRLATRSGEVLKTKIVQDEIIISEVKRLIEALKPCGQVAVQLISEKNTNKNYYIEINPRFGGGAPLSIKAGADSAEALLKLLNGEKLSYVSYAAKDGDIYSRFDQSIKVSA